MAFSQRTDLPPRQVDSLTGLLHTPQRLGPDQPKNPELHHIIRNYPKDWLWAFGKRADHERPQSRSLRRYFVQWVPPPRDPLFAQTSLANRFLPTLITWASCGTGSW